jgi:hypothetical protein
MVMSLFQNLEIAILNLSKFLDRRLSALYMAAQYQINSIWKICHMNSWNQILSLTNNWESREVRVETYPSFSWRHSSELLLLLLLSAVSCHDSTVLLLHASAALHAASLHTSPLVVIWVSHLILNTVCHLIQRHWSWRIHHQLRYTYLG